MKDSEIKNALITSTKLGFDEYYSFWLSLDYGGGGQGFGGYLLGGEFTDYVLQGILKALDVDTWEQLPGTSCRVESSSSKVHRIGHYLKDQWFSPGDYEVKS